MVRGAAAHARASLARPSTTHRTPLVQTSHSFRRGRRAPARPRCHLVHAWVECHTPGTDAQFSVKARRGCLRIYGILFEHLCLEGAHLQEEKLRPAPCRLQLHRGATCSLNARLYSTLVLSGHTPPFAPVRTRASPSEIHGKRYRTLRFKVRYAGCSCEWAWCPAPARQLTGLLSRVHALIYQIAVSFFMLFLRARKQGKKNSPIISLINHRVTLIFFTKRKRPAPDESTRVGNCHEHRLRGSHGGSGTTSVSWPRHAHPISRRVQGSPHRHRP